MNKTQSHAQKELEILIKTTPDAIIRDFIPEILAVCEAFGKSGQSGGSAPYTAHALSEAIKKLCLQQTIAPLTGEDDEWVNVSDLGGKNDTPLFQNKRLSSVFKDEIGCWYLDAITWKTQSGNTWTGSAKTIEGQEVQSRQYIKEFPFTPKDFIIDIYEKEVTKDNWEFTIKDMEKLLEVAKYYKFPYVIQIDN